VEKESIAMVTMLSWIEIGALFAALVRIGSSEPPIGAVQIISGEG
jgi:hypothetical protein